MWSGTTEYFVKTFWGTECGPCPAVQTHHRDRGVHHARREEPGAQAVRGVPRGPAGGVHPWAPPHHQGDEVPRVQHTRGQECCPGA